VLPVERPNILFLLADQLRWDFLGCYGAGFARTPHLDRLAAQAVVYERAVSQHPVCIPARAALLTGCNALTTGVLANNLWLRPDHAACGMPGWPALLAEGGYHTAAIGKMHFIPWDAPEGFATRVIAEDKRHVHIEDDYHAHLAAKGLRKSRGWEMPGYTEHKMACVSPLGDDDQVDVWVGRQAVRFLDAHEAGEPWALMVSFPGPHDPYDPPAERAGRFALDAMPASRPDTPESLHLRRPIALQHRGGSSRVDLDDFPEAARRRVRAHYAALVEMIDEQVGAILDAVDRRGECGRTLVVLASDHGDFLGDYGLLGKSLFLEPAMHVPLLARWPGAAGGARSRRLVTVTDLFATVLAAAGIASPTGRDSFPLPGLGLGDRPGRPHALCALAEGSCIDDGHYRLARYADGLATLYDLEQDPGETRNLVADPVAAGVRERLDALLAAEALRAVAAGHDEKRYPYVTMTAGHPAHRRGWQRPYPAAAIARP